MRGRGRAPSTQPLQRQYHSPAGSHQSFGYHPTDVHDYMTNDYGEAPFSQEYSDDVWTDNRTSAPPSTKKSKNGRGVSFSESELATIAMSICAGNF